ncbi:MAG: SpoIIE family protein phosphatase [Bacillota bacterium]
MGEQDDLLTTIIDTVPDIIGILNPDYTIERYNEAGYEFFSASAKELKDKKCYQVLGNSSKCDNCPLEKVLKTKEIVETEQYIAELDSYFEIRSKPVLNQEGEVIKIIEYLKDVTEKKEAQNNLAKRSQLLEGILASIDGGISVLDSELNIKYVNQTIKDWNLDRLPLHGKKCYEVYHNRIKPCEICPTLKALDSGKTETDMVIDDRGSEVKFFKVSSYPLHSKEEDQPTEVVEFIQDVTEQQEQNEKLSSQLQKGKEIHQHLLPTNLPRSANIKISSFYRPAEEIGADFYQTIEFEDQILFYVSDVIGHNLDGAFLNIFLRETIRAFLAEKHDPSHNIYLEEIMDYIIYRYRLENFPDDYFISLALFVFNKNSRKLDYLNAGMHIEPFLIKNHELSRLGAKGMPISNFSNYKDSNYGKDTLHFSKNDTLIVTTDGLIEAEKNRAIFGEERLTDLLLANYHLPLELLLIEVIKNLEDFKGDAPIKDDVTLLALRNQSFIDSLYLKIASDFKEVDKVKQKAKEFLKLYYQETDAILIGLHEAIINAIEHGNQQKYDSAIKIYISISKDALIIEVEDEGKGFDWRKELSEEYNLNDFNERGRGIKISKEIFDYFGYNQFGNRVIMYLAKTAKTSCNP